MSRGVSSVLRFSKPQSQPRVACLSYRRAMTEAHRFTLWHLFVQRPESAQGWVTGCPRALGGCVLGVKSDSFVRYTSTCTLRPWSVDSPRTPGQLEPDYHIENECYMGALQPPSGYSFIFTGQLRPSSPAALTSPTSIRMWNSARHVTSGDQR